MYTTTEVVELKQLIRVSEIIKKVNNVIRDTMINAIVLVSVVEFVLPLGIKHKYLRIYVV